MVALAHVVDAVIAFTIAEAALLALYHRRTGKGVPPREFGANMLSGLCLMLALRLALSPVWWGWVLASLLAAGLAHGADLRRRWMR
ncbi:hypothetical protein BH11PSE9_BH11PSE9_03330 [soil metagenome]